MSFGNNFKLLNSKVNIDLKPFIKDPVSRKAKNMIDFHKYLQYEDRKFEVLARNEAIVNNYSIL